MLLIGSRAMPKDFGLRRDYWEILVGPLKEKYVKHTDFDYICTYQEYNKWLADNQDYIVSGQELFPNHFCIHTFDEIYEFEIAVEGSSGELYLEAYKNGVPIEQILFSIYKSHIYMPVKWRKHIASYGFLGEMVGFKDSLSHITKLRFTENEAIHGKMRTPSLNKGKMDFFNDKTIDIRVFEHDDIHKVMAHYEAPLFEQIKPDKDKVLCSKDLWDKLSYGDRCKCVLEEVYVIALERKLIPMMFLGKEPATPHGAFLWALQRVCTNLCSGWFREFASDNALYLIETYNTNYVDKFMKAFNNKKIVKLKN